MKNVGATLPVLQILLVRIAIFFVIYSHAVPLNTYANVLSHNVIKSLCNLLELNVGCHLNDP